MNNNNKVLDDVGLSFRKVKKVSAKASPGYRMSVIYIRKCSCDDSKNDECA